MGDWTVFRTGGGAERDATGDLTLDRAFALMLALAGFHWSILGSESGGFRLALVRKGPRLKPPIGNPLTISEFSAPILSHTLDNWMQTGAVSAGAKISYTVGSGSGRALLVCVYSLNGPVQAPTYKGIPLGLVANSTYPGVGRLGVAAYLMLKPPIGPHALVFGDGTRSSMIVSYSGVSGLDTESTADATSQSTITDTVTTTHDNDALIMCETDSGAGTNSWAHSSTTGTVELLFSGLSYGITVSGVPSGTNSFSITAGDGNPPPASLIADVLLALSPN